MTLWLGYMSLGVPVGVCGEGLTCVWGMGTRGVYKKGYIELIYWGFGRNGGVEVVVDVDRVGRVAGLCDLIGYFYSWWKNAVCN